MDSNFKNLIINSFNTAIYLLLSAMLRIRIRIRRIHMFLGLPDPDQLVRDMAPDPSIIKQK